MHIITFDIPLKYIAPYTLLGMFAHQILHDVEGNGGNHPAWLDGVAGGGLLSVLLLSLLIFAVYPGFWDVMGVDENQGAQVAYYAVRPFVCGSPVHTPPSLGLRSCFPFFQCFLKFFLYVWLVN
jgi:hypothetical protein